MRQIHLPVWLSAVAKPHAAAFVALFSLESFSRATLIAVLPLDGLALLGDAQQVSVLYFAVSVFGLASSLSMPAFVRLIRRRWMITLAAACTVASMALFSTQTAWGFILGLALRGFSSVANDVTLNLYLLDHIPRRQLNFFEPRRIFVGGSAYIVGPWLGVFLQGKLGTAAPFVVAAGAAASLLAYFWFLRITESPVVPPMTRPPPPPLRYLKRFAEQPRLVLGYLLVVGRSGWWTMFFVYAPIYLVTAGFDAQTAGLLVSVGMVGMLLVPVWGSLGRRFGLRRLLIVAFTLTGLLTLVLSLVAGLPGFGAAMLIVTPFAGAIIDGAGNVPFLRAVRPLERAEMTSVFATYRDVAQLVPMGIFSVVLKLAQLPAVFAVGGASMLVLAYYCRYLPRRM